MNKLPNNFLPFITSEGRKYIIEKFRKGEEFTYELNNNGVLTCTVKTTTFTFSIVESCMINTVKQLTDYLKDPNSHYTLI